VPETPRFLLSKGKEEEAFQFFVTYHGNGDTNDELVHFEFQEMKLAIQQEQEAKAETWSNILKRRSNLHRLGLAALMIFCTNMSGSSIIYYYYTVVFDLVGITNPTTQTGISAGLYVFTWFCQIAAVFLGKRVDKRTILLWVWPTLLLGLIGLCVSTGVFSNGGEVNNHAGVATVVLVWIYLGCFNFSNPILYSYPAEVQTFSMRSKGLLVWNTLSQFTGAYVVWVDAIALNAIGYKYYIVYMPLVIIQWILLWKCECSPSSRCCYSSSFILLFRPALSVQAPHHPRLHAILPPPQLPPPPTILIPSFGFPFLSSSSFQVSYLYYRSHPY